MPIPDPLRSFIYESGVLIQQCNACEWAQRGHSREIPDCPLCGKKLNPPLALEFGGFAVVFDGANFSFYDDTGQVTLLQRADYPEVIQFLCRHGEDVRTRNTTYDGHRPKRIVKSKHFTDLLRW
jgi:hypothetical protein